MATQSIALGGGAGKTGTAAPGSSKIRVTVYENDNEVDIQNYSGNELEALEQVIQPLWRTVDDMEGSVEVEWDDTRMYLVFRDWDGKECAFPEELLTKTIGLKGNKHALVGNLIQVKPPKYGMNRWPAKVAVKFTVE